MLDILNGYTKSMCTVDVTIDDMLKQAVKEFSDWPTIP